MSCHWRSRSTAGAVVQEGEVKADVFGHVTVPGFAVSPKAANTLELSVK